MNTERAAMKGLLAEARGNQARLRLKIDGLCQAIRAQLNTAITDVDDLDVPLAASRMDDLVGAYAELTALSGRIARIEKELG